MLTHSKKQEDLQFLNEVSCVPLQQGLIYLQKAFSNFFVEPLKIADTQHEPPKSIDFARRTQEIYQERKLSALQAPRYNRPLEQIFGTYCR